MAKNVISLPILFVSIQKQLWFNQRMSQPLIYDSDDPDDIWDGDYTWDEEIDPNKTMLEIPITNVTYPEEDVLGLCQDTTELVNSYKTKMIANGTDPTAALALLAPAQSDLSAQNKVQEGIKTQLRDQTPIVEAARDKAYSYSSYLIDQVISAFGRNSEQAKEATNLRKKLHPARTNAAAKATKAAKQAQNP